MDSFQALPEKERKVLAIAWRAMNLGSNVKASHPSKKDLVNMNIPLLCDTLSTPNSKLALRVTAQLLVGIVKVLQHQHYCVYEDTVQLWTRICRESALMTIEDIDMPLATARQSSITFSEREFGQLGIDYKNSVFSLLLRYEPFPQQDEEYICADQEVSRPEYEDQTVSQMNTSAAQEPSRLSVSLESDPLRTDAMEIDILDQEPSIPQDYLYEGDHYYLDQPEPPTSSINSISEHQATVLPLEIGRFSREAADILTDIRSPISRRRSTSTGSTFSEQVAPFDIPEIEYNPRQASEGWDQSTTDTENNPALVPQLLHNLPVPRLRQRTSVRSSTILLPLDFYEKSRLKTLGFGDQRQTHKVWIFIEMIRLAIIAYFDPFYLIRIIVCTVSTPLHSLLNHENRPRLHNNTLVSPEYARRYRSSESLNEDYSAGTLYSANEHMGILEFQDGTDSEETLALEESNQRYRRSNSPSFGHPSSIDIQYSPSPLDLQYEGVEYGDSFPNTLGGASAIIEEHLSSSSRNACALAGKTYIEFEQLLYDGQNCPRSQVAHVFYQLLVLASINKLDVVQSEPYGCIKFRAQ
ncbi:hypothetical protein PHYBLDRAFT_148684 [Phycomyces blakesleeanus NRRL 1555(-)]|uniref:Rad21/Rec8-like protein N-terminal domain-containing protein n=1 Tax=Phycomyces blakesleeanus (strain ATCC 8743b / DSM 1359 / FGSC 10004 / NBRC 33097 / NRRL 1555) TaxID=763407 RepID=A0A167LCF6_PHYB8|nr:hypothetical protein PHYBLDRAFT_148684 [Phycomyces blakesleeanus NRRL 1555(-)]OAD70128.1 hypothetical protein PHYBLDRAFT_148684 [Phycomyces blakesleeanus NRRL 1555(-)]|eukprot:XP_018288168.1 hypothetical protein PHYBLDRAFT_148684 [Phycomyces blakesleeanus NRRL 1555(-)]